MCSKYFCLFHKKESIAGQFHISCDGGVDKTWLFTDWSMSRWCHYKLNTSCRGRKGKKIMSWQNVWSVKLIWMCHFLVKSRSCWDQKKRKMPSDKEAQEKKKTQNKTIASEEMIHKNVVELERDLRGVSDREHSRGVTLCPGWVSSSASAPADGWWDTSGGQASGVTGRGIGSNVWSRFFYHKIKQAWIAQVSVYVFIFNHNKNEI